MGDRVELRATDGQELSAYTAGGDDPHAAVVIVQEIYGVNVHIRSVVDTYAGLGYLAIAPALFDRIERDVELEYDEAGAAVGGGLRDRLDWSSVVVDVSAAVDHVRRERPVAVVGYCYGGSVAWLAANELQLDAAVCYYGGHIRRFIDRAPRCPTMLHFGAADHMIPLEDVADVDAAHPEVTVQVYDDAGHGFNCDIRASYDPAAALLAQRRTNDFLAKHLW